MFARLFRAAPLVAFGILLAAVMVQRVTIVRVVAERDRLVTAVTEATVPADAKGSRKPLTPDEALAAARGLARDRDDARASLATVSRATAAAKQRDVAADAGLRRTQAVNVDRFARETAPRIAAVKAVRPTGDEARDDATLSNVLGEAWK